MNSLIYQSSQIPENVVQMPMINDFSGTLEYVLPENICQSIIATMRTFGQSSEHSVGVQGTSAEGGKGSRRISFYNTEFAKYLTEEISSSVPPFLNLKPNEPMDWESDNPEGFNVWAFEGVSPYFRYMTYTQGGQHFPHYDSSYKLPEDTYIRTLMSGVLYLTTNKTGATAFIDDKQDDVAFKDKKLDDWDRQATVEELYSWSLPTVGKMIIFPHQLCHSMLPLLDDEERIIIRFDLFYNALKKE